MAPTKEAATGVGPVSGEHERIARLRARLEAQPSDVVALGPGDDAALLRPANGLEVVTVDASIEGTHFRRGWAPLDVLAARAVTAAISDVAAMGGAVRACLLALALPPDLDDAGFDALIDGAASAAEAAGSSLVGGNLTRASELGLTTTVLGEVEAPGLRRDGGRPGDGLWVVGAVGWARIGLEILMRRDAGDHEAADSDEPALEAWSRPRARLAEGRALRNLATAAIDLSDGLAQDLGHLCRASGVGAGVDLDALLRQDGVEAAARSVGLDPVEAICGGGDDYALLFSLPAGAAPPFPARRVGSLDGAAGVRFFVEGRGISPRALGFDHFRPDD